MLFLEDPFVVFEVQVKKLGLIKKPVETVKAEVGLIDSIRLVEGLFSDKLYIVPKRSDLLTAVPGRNRGELRLKVAKRYRDDAEDFVAEVLRKKREKKAGD